jgi:hypothetical protein
MKQILLNVQTVETDRPNEKMLIISTPKHGYEYTLYLNEEMNRYDWTIGKPLKVARFRTEFDAVRDCLVVCLAKENL